MALKALIFDIQTDVINYQEKHGKTDQSEKSLIRANKMIELVEKLDKVANHNNTAQLLIRHNHLMMSRLKSENEELKKQLENVSKQWK